MANEANGRLRKDLDRLELDDAQTGGSAHNARLRETVKRHHFERDITNTFESSCKDLETDELVKHGRFALFEAVSALEIMDDKVDVGVCPSSECYFDELDITEQLSPEVILGIMDGIISLEVMWHDGLPLSQTLTQTRRDIPDSTEMVLRAFCLGVIKGCDMIIELVTSREYQEEEDLCTNTYGRDLYTDIEDDAVVKELDAGLQWIDEQTALSANIKNALSLRLQARRDFLTAFLAQQGQNHFDRWQGMETRYEEIQKSHCFARGTPHVFSTKVLRKISGNVPPRKVQNIAFDYACTNQMRLCNDTQEALRVLEFDSTVTMDPIFDFLWSFASRSPAPSAFPRAVLQAHFVAPGHIAGPNEISQLLFNELNRFLSVEDEIRSDFWDMEVPSHPHHQVARLVDRFFSTVGLTFEKMLRGMCQNKCRIRRGLTNTLEELSFLPEELVPPLSDGFTAVETQDPENALYAKTKKHFSTVVAISCSRFATWVTQLGIEQDLYEDYEMANMYCWIAINTRKLCDVFGELETIIRQKVAQSYTIVSEEETYVNLTKAEALAAQRLRWEGVSSLAEGIWMTYATLCQTQHFTPPGSPYSMPALQHELRFRPYLNLAKFLPVPASFESWTHTVSRGLGSADADSADPPDDKASASSKFTSQGSKANQPSSSSQPSSANKPSSVLAMLQTADAALSKAREHLTHTLKQLKQPDLQSAEAEFAGVYDVGSTRASVREDVTRMLRVAVTARLGVSALLNVLHKTSTSALSGESMDEAQTQIGILQGAIKEVTTEKMGSWVLPKIKL